MRQQSKEGFPNDTKKNPKDCMAIQLRSGKELEGKEAEKKFEEERQISSKGTEERKKGEYAATTTEG